MIGLALPGIEVVTAKRVAIKQAYFVLVLVFAILQNAIGFAMQQPDPMNGDKGGDVPPPNTALPIVGANNDTNRIADDNEREGVGSRPIRRIFVPQSELPELTLDRMRPIELDRLPTLLQQLSESWEANTTNKEVVGASTIQSLHAFARLVGRDFVSDRTRLRFHEDSLRSGPGMPRRRLAPWNLAIDDFRESYTDGIRGNNQNGNPPVVGSDGRLKGDVAVGGKSNLWVHDDIGIPWVDASKPELWTGWSLRPESEAGPNQLRYRLRIPRSVDGCLVLQLPKRAKVESSDVATVRFGDWNDVLARFENWPDRNPVYANPTPSGVDAAFWGIELSGRSEISLTVDLGSSELRSSVVSPSDQWGVARLITKQAIQYSLGGEDLRVQYEWEWTEPVGESVPFRLEMPEGYKLRSLSLNDREVTVEADRNRLEIAIPKLSDRSASPKYKMAAEFLYRLPKEHSQPQGSIRVPSVLNRNGYVLAGTTILQDGAKSEFLAVRPAQGRLESARRNSEGNQRLEYSWFQQPPVMEFQWRERIRTNRYESMTRIAIEAGQVQAFVRLRAYFEPQTPVSFLDLPAGWLLDTQSVVVKPPRFASENRVLGDGDAIRSASVEGGVSNSPKKLRIDHPGTSNGEVTLEFRLFRALSAEDALQLAKEPWFAISGWESSNAIVVEANGTSSIDIEGPIRNWLIAEEDLPSWEKEYLPRLGKYVLFRIEDGRLPPLFVRTDRELQSLDILSLVRRSGEDWCVEHRLPLAGMVQRPTEFHVQLPPSFDWFLETEKGALPVDAAYDVMRQEWTIQISGWRDSENLPFKSLLAREFRKSPLLQPLKGVSEGSSWELIPPKIRDFSSRVWTIDLGGSLSLAIPRELEHTRTEISNGSRYIIKARQVEPSIKDSPRINSSSATVLNASTASHVALSAVQVVDLAKARVSATFFRDMQMHLVIDASGRQSLLIDATILRTGAERQALQWKIPKAWRGGGAQFIAGNGSTQSLNVEHDREQGQVSVILPESDGTENIRLRLRLIGPNLNGTKYPNVGAVAQTGSERLPSSDAQWNLKELLPDSWFPTLFQETKIYWPAVNCVSAEPIRSQRFLIFPAGGALNVERRPDTPKPGVSLLPFSSWFRTAVHSWFPTEFPWGEGLDYTQSNEKGLWDSVAWEPSWDSATLAPVLSNRSWQTPAVWLGLLAVFFSAGLFPRWPWFIVGLAVVSAGSMPWLPSAFVIFPQFFILGLGVGALLQRTSRLVLESTLQMPTKGPGERWRSWNLPDDEPNESEDTGILSTETADKGLGKSLPITVLWILLGATCFSVSCGRLVLAQDLFSSGPKVFDVLIPVDEEGKVAGTTVYVPVELLDWAEQREKFELQQMGQSSVLSSRHSIRLDGRSVGFAMADPSVSSMYEIEVGELAIGKPIRIPYPIDTLKLGRFTVDGLEVLSGRLSRSDTDLTWFPERSGKRVLQLEGTTRLVVLDGSNRESAGQRVPGGATDKQKDAWLVDLPVLPACNAVLDLEADGNWVSEVEAFGRSMNPSSGKTIVQLGNKSRLRVELQMQPTSANRGAPLAMPGDLPSSTSDQPTMNTELFIDREQLLARTVVDFPRGSFLGNEIEIEADTQWAPIGSQWGDAQLVEIKTGSTLDRNRFVLRWRVNDEESARVADGGNRRSITTTWIPVGDAPLRSVLFAECRDRRVRQGTLRYSRAAGSVWGLDSISSWIPAINAKDRLDWPELREFPLTTNLRIPINSGFGVLRRQAKIQDKNLGVDCSLHFGPSFGTAVWRVQARGPIGNQETLLFSLPAPLRVEQVAGTAGPLEFKSWSYGEVNYTQVFLDRLTESTSDFRITGSYPLKRFSEVEPFVVMPELNMIGWTSDEGKLAITADPQWKLRIRGENDSESLVVGKGVQQNLWAGGMEDSALRSMSLQAIEQRWYGALVLQSQTEIDELGETYWVTRIAGVRKTSSADSWNSIELSIPRELGSEIQSDSSYRELSSLRWDQLLLRVEPILQPTATETDAKSLDSYLVDFTFELRKDASQDPLQVLGGLSSRFLVEGQSVPVWIVRSVAEDRQNTPPQTVQTEAVSTSPAKASPLSTPRVTADVQLTNAALKSFGLQSSNHQLVAAVANSQSEFGDVLPSSSSMRCLLASHQHTAQTLYSEFWLIQDAGMAVRTDLNFQLPNDAQCLWVCINGTSVPFNQNESKLRVDLPNANEAQYVEIWVKDSQPNRLGVPVVKYDQGGDYRTLIEEEFDGQPYVSPETSPRTVVINEVLGICKKWLTFPSVTGRSDGMSKLVAHRAAKLLREALQFPVKSSENLEGIDFAEWGRLLKPLLAPRQPLNFSGVLGATEVLGVGSPIRKSRIPGARDITAEEDIPRGMNHTWADLIFANLPQGLRYFVPLILCGVYLFIYATNVRRLQQRPWWELLLLGLGWFAWTGSIFLLLVFGALAALLVCDTYWLISVRSRQIALRGPR